MVLPSPSTVSGQSPRRAWLDELISALEFVDQPALWWVVGEAPSSLPLLVRALAARRVVEVVSTARDLRALALGSTVVLIVTPADFPWLNRFRTVVADRNLRVVVWSNIAVREAARSNAPDFYTWVTQSWIAPKEEPAYVREAIASLLLGDRELGTPDAAVLEYLPAPRPTMFNGDLPWSGLCDLAARSGLQVWSCRDRWAADRVRWARRAVGAQTSALLVVGRSGPDFDTLIVPPLDPVAGMRAWAARRRSPLDAFASDLDPGALPRRLTDDDRHHREFFSSIAEAVTGAPVDWSLLDRLCAAGHDDVAVALAKATPFEALCTAVSLRVQGRWPEAAAALAGLPSSPERGLEAARLAADREEPIRFPRAPDRGVRAHWAALRARDAATRCRAGAARKWAEIAGRLFRRRGEVAEALACRLEIALLDGALDDLHGLASRFDALGRSGLWAEAAHALDIAQLDGRERHQVRRHLREVLERVPHGGSKVAGRVWASLAHARSEDAEAVAPLRAPEATIGALIAETATLGIQRREGVVVSPDRIADLGRRALPFGSCEVRHVQLSLAVSAALAAGDRASALRLAEGVAETSDRLGLRARSSAMLLRAVDAPAEALAVARQLARSVPGLPRSMAVPLLTASALVAVAAGDLERAQVWVRRAEALPRTPARDLLVARVRAEVALAVGEPAGILGAWRALAAASHAWAARAAAVEFVVRASALPPREVVAWAMNVWWSARSAQQRLAFAWLLVGLDGDGSELWESLRTVGWTNATAWSLIPTVGRWWAGSPADWLSLRVDANADELTRALLRAGRDPSARALEDAAEQADLAKEPVLAAGLRRRATWCAGLDTPWARGMRAFRSGDRHAADAELRVALAQFAGRPEEVLVALQLAEVAGDGDALRQRAEGLALAYGVAVPEVEFRAPESAA